MNDFNQQIFNLKNALPSSRRSKISVICLLIMLPISFAIGKICFRSNLFILILELIAWRVNNLARTARSKHKAINLRSKHKAINLITLSIVLNLAELIVAFGVLVKYLIEYMH